MEPQKQSMNDKAFRSLGNLIKLLPSGTVFAYQFLNPLLTNNGHCVTLNKVLDAALLVGCAVSCAISCFTDSYITTDGRVYYGIVTPKGLHPFSDPEAGKRNFSGYRLRFADFVHALLCLVVLAVVAVLDTNTVSCFWPELLAAQPVLIKVLPTAVGAFVSGVFVVFPNKRHGIGYPLETTEMVVTVKGKEEDGGGR